MDAYKIVTDAEWKIDHNEISLGEYYDTCKTSNKSIGRYNGERCPDCPLVEVKTPHGRLIDEGNIHTGIRMEKNTEYRYFIDRVNAPTVIEAEVE